MNIPGKERQDDGILLEWPAEQSKEEGARGWVQYAGKFIPDFSDFNEFRPIQRIRENTYVKVESNKRTFRAMQADTVY